MFRIINYLGIIFFLTFFFLQGYSQPLTINWQQCLGGNQYDEGVSILKIKEGFLLLCETGSSDGQIIGSHGGQEYWLIKVDTAGNILWQHAYGGNGDDSPMKMIPCLDGGYLLCGTSTSITPQGGYNGDVYGQHGGFDYWLLKIDSIGTIEWSRCYGGSYVDIPTDIASTTDSGFLVCGLSNSLDGDVTENHGGYDAWVIRVDKNGNLKWEKSYGGSMPDWANSIVQTSDYGFIMAGMVESNDGNVLCDLHGRSDVWMVKGDSAGNIDWQKCLGGSDYDNASDIIIADDGGYLMAGTTHSNDGDVTLNHGGGDIWVVKINNTGDLLWQQSYGGSKDEEAQVVIALDSNSFLIGGSTDSNDGNVTGNNSWPDGYYDIWLIKISSNGDLTWQNCLGGDQNENVKDLMTLPNGQMMVLGSTTTSNTSGDVYCDHHGPGTDDVWLVSITDTTEVGIEPKEHTGGSIIAYPNPANDFVVFQYSLKGNYSYPNIRILDEFGNVIETIQLTESSGKAEWNTGNIKAGLYFYQVNTDLVSLTGKIMIIK